MFNERLNVLFYHQMSGFFVGFFAIFLLVHLEMGSVLDKCIFSHSLTHLFTPLMVSFDK